MNSPNTITIVYFHFDVSLNREYLIHYWTRFYNKETGQKYDAEHSLKLWKVEVNTLKVSVKITIGVNIVGDRIEKKSGLNIWGVLPCYYKS